MSPKFIKLSSLFVATLLASNVFAQQPAGEIKDTETVHTEASAREAISSAQVALPASVTGAAVYLGALSAAPAGTGKRVPVVVFMHGSSGLALKAIGEWQQWLAGIGIASIAPNSFALPKRLTYKSPIDKAVYEKIHALRLSEVTLAARALPDLPWTDASRTVLAGTSEGAVPVARYTGTEFLGRILMAWSCEDNYFVQNHKTALPDDKPVLNIISSVDPFFSATNSWIGNPSAQGHCAAALKNNKQASVLLIPGAPHTLMNLPQARAAAEAFLRDLLKP
ncbi:MAG: alpha/beta hydrolase [Betaproteobacteria bacterium]|nr:MAG: alpha/beta hydrolase [Betaproteobacteria bacterium]